MDQDQEREVGVADWREDTEAVRGAGNKRSFSLIIVVRSGP